MRRRAPHANFPSAAIKASGAPPDCISPDTRLIQRTTLSWIFRRHQHSSKGVSMGKDSLLESTSKKKTAAKGDAKKPVKKKSAAKKATGAKTTAKAKKAAPAKKTTATKKSAPAPKKSAAQKAAPPKGAATKAQKATAKSPAKKPTRKELLWKKFDTYPTGVLYTPAVRTRPDQAAEAPSYFSGMPEAAAQKAREYLKRQFVWADIKAAGEKYAAKLAAQAEEEAKRKAEEEAKRKAEEEAKRKAEEEAKRKAEEEAKRKAEEEAKRKAAAQTPPPPADAGAGSGFNPMKIGIAGFCAIILLLIVSSYSNTKHYYITPKDGAVEIWRGTFAPMGKTRVMILPGIQMPQEQKEVYGWQDAYRLMYQYYIEKADALLQVPGVPDTAGLNQNLEMAIRYAPNRELLDKARARLVSIRMQTLVQKAQAALNRGTIESAKEAIGFLKEAQHYDLSDAEAEMIQRKIDEAEAILANREMAKAEAEKAAAEKEALEAEAQSLKEASDNPPPITEETGH
jgi:colicin import membrane protein